jgi:pimeloyl-ACP methyl ester carboxylesterase
VARAAAFEPRVAAIAGIGGAYRMPQPPPLIWRKFKHSAQLDDDAAAADHAAKFTLDGVASRITQPYLVVCGGADHINGTEGAERKVAEAPAGVLKILPEGGVACHSVGHLAKPFVADWLNDHLRER